MGAPPNSQVAPLPSNVNFRLISKTIGSGAYASIRKATPLNATNPVIAVKFINKAHAYRTGHLRPKQLQIELSLHQAVNGHANIIKYLSHGHDDNWVWLCLELADGGDLFDKIEADEGVSQDVAHLYFFQLVSAIDWCHSKGVAHRDIKPENMLLSHTGDLKLADFGLATNFCDVRKGYTKGSSMVCGSPPYIAPEILAVGKINGNRKGGTAEENGKPKAEYAPNVADVWSCAIVLFVLLAGNTPWDSPVIEESAEYAEYIAANGRPSPDEELWDKIPPRAMSLVQGMLRVAVDQRFSLSQVRSHSWFNRKNAHLDNRGLVADPVALATQMIEQLHVDPSKEPSRSQPQRVESDAMDIDDDTRRQPVYTDHAATQPDTPAAMEGAVFDWEAPPRLGLGGGVNALNGQYQNQNINHISASQPAKISNVKITAAETQAFVDSLAQDPAMSQFSQKPSVPLTLTQQARRFNEIMPSHTLARFCSLLPRPQLLDMLVDALRRLDVHVNLPSEQEQMEMQDERRPCRLKIKAVDDRKQLLGGALVIERTSYGDSHSIQRDGLEVTFQKSKGDPVSWRRLFKDVVRLCHSGVVMLD